ncbi:MAG: hypothetical protein EDM03_12230 [Porphyrobacter sp. IPPAS B-1204]|nr:MAG: hypothetical protein EDM03_12230 [Porphyrobacter sp. IPPAS B-1204]
MKSVRLPSPLAAFSAAVLLALPHAATAQAGGQLVVGNDPAPPLAPTAPDQWQNSLDRLARARDNLAAILDGRQNISALTPEELLDVIELDRTLRNNVAEPRSFQQQCIDDEVRRAGGRPSRLAWQVIRLKCR